MPDHVDYIDNKPLTLCFLCSVRKNGRVYFVLQITVTAACMATFVLAVLFKIQETYIILRNSVVPSFETTYVREGKCCYRHCLRSERELFFSVGCSPSLITFGGLNNLLIAALSTAPYILRIPNARSSELFLFVYLFAMTLTY